MERAKDLNIFNFTRKTIYFYVNLGTKTIFQNGDKHFT
jgi:hypothetical protein